jgi:hypothetical protein
MANQTPTALRCRLLVSTGMWAEGVVLNVTQTRILYLTATVGALVEELPPQWLCPAEERSQAAFGPIWFKSGNTTNLQMTALQALLLRCRSTNLPCQPTPTRKIVVEMTARAQVILTAKSKPGNQMIQRRGQPSNSSRQLAIADRLHHKVPRHHTARLTVHLPNSCCRLRWPRPPVPPPPLASTPLKTPLKTCLPLEFHRLRL